MNIMSKFQVPISYCLGIVKKGHVRGNSIDNRRSISIAWGIQGHKGGVRGQDAVPVVQGGF